MDATHYETPSARMVIDYVADSGCVTLADLEAYFDIPAHVAVLCIAAAGIADCGDGTYEVPAEKDPDDLTDAFAAAVGVDYIDTPIDEIDDVLAKIKAGPASKPKPTPTPPSTPADFVARRKAQQRPEPKGDGTEIGDPDHDAPEALPPLHEVLDPEAVALVEVPADVLAELLARVEALTARVEALEASPKAKAKAKPTKKAKGRAGKKNLQAMIDAGLVSVGDTLSLKGEVAQLVSATEVKVLSDNGGVGATINTNINAWALRVTGWQSVNVYNYVRVVEKDQTLDQIRRGL